MSAGLLPREHGAYAQLGFPVLTGLAYSGGSPGGFAFAVAAIALFLAHEPMAVLVGARGVRLREALDGPSRRRLWLLGVVAAMALVAAALLAPGRAWWAGLAPAVPGLALAPLFLTNRIKTLAGEVVAAAAFAATLLPVALSGPAEVAVAWVAAGVWLGALVPAIVAVHAVKVSHKGTPRGRWLVPSTPALAVVVATVSVALALAYPWPVTRTLSVLPPMLVVLVVGILRPHPRHLKRIGWAMVAAYVVTFSLLLLI